jgi:hypothetical protein
MTISQPETLLPIPYITRQPVNMSTVMFVRDLGKILCGTRAAADDDDDSHEHDTCIGQRCPIQGDENLEAQVLAACCLANLMETLPGVVHTVVYHRAIPVLCSKLSLRIRVYVLVILSELTSNNPDTPHDHRDLLHDFGGADIERTFLFFCLFVSFRISYS